MPRVSAAPLRARRIASSAAAAVLAGCTSTVSVAVPDGGVVGGDPCGVVIDLNARATPQADGSRSLVVTRPASPAAVPAALPSCLAGELARLAWATAFRYTAARSTQVSFTLVDGVAAQPMALASLLVDTCAARCTVYDSAFELTGAWGVRREITVRRALAAGESVVLLVGTPLPQSPSVDLAGSYEVRVRELPVARDGDPCGPQLAWCPGGTTCHDTLRRCVPAGALGQPCLPEFRCAAGLACDPTDAVCKRALRPGDPCDAPDLAAVCPAETDCVLFGASSRQCVARGARGGGCRTTEPRCDDGLSCDGPRCRPSATEGGVLVGDHACPHGTFPVTDAQGTTRCPRDGALHGLCVGIARTCDAGLACTGDDFATAGCLPAVALGAACDTAHGRSACARGSCVRGVCVLDGTRDAHCRATDAPCDPGLGCVGDTRRCLRLAAIGESCTFAACPARSTCAATDADERRCRVDGTDGGRCRVGGGPCDDGLACAHEGDPERVGYCRRAVREGDACDPHGFANACAEGLGCDASARCAPLGRDGTRCRTSAPECDAPRVCVADAGLCETPIASGNFCNPQAPSPCAEGTACIARRPQAPTTCEPWGSVVGSPCRSSPPACDGELVCALLGATCVVERAVGGACNVRESTDRCAAGASCLPDGAMGGRCVRDGIAGGRCRPTGPTCDDGLSCSGLPPEFAARCR